MILLKCLMLILLAAWSEASVPSAASRVEAVEARVRTVILELQGHLRHFLTEFVWVFKSIAQEINDKYRIVESRRYSQDVCYDDVCGLSKVNTSYPFDDIPVDGEVVDTTEYCLLYFINLECVRDVHITLSLCLFLLHIVNTACQGLKSKQSTKNGVKPKQVVKTENYLRLQLCVFVEEEIRQFVVLVSEPVVAEFLSRSDADEMLKQKVLQLQFQLAKMTKCWVHLRLMRELAKRTYSKAWFNKNMLHNKERYFKCPPKKRKSPAMTLS